MVCRELRIIDPVILEAIRLHSTGDAGMRLESCIVFMADLTEAGRSYEGVGLLRTLSRQDLRGAMIEAIEQTFDYLRRAQKPLHQGTSRCLAWLKVKKEGEQLWKARN
jgi:HD superfamily phosphohydrolase YqeK